MRIRFWAKTFIPGKLFRINDEELTWHARILSGMPEQEDSLIPLFAIIPSLWFLGSSYTTDNRSFSKDIHASARMATLIDIQGPDKIKLSREIRPTIQVRGLLMDWIGNKHEHVTMKKAQYAPNSNQESIEQSKEAIHIAFKTVISNPFFELGGIHYAPPTIQEFDLDLNFKEAGQINLRLRGRTTRFPAFEAYVQIEDNEPVCLFQYHPPKGATPLNLFYGWQAVQIEKCISTQIEKKLEKQDPLYSSKEKGENQPYFGLKSRL
ncbi:MAG TPA: hypothetical protein VLH77_01450 [Gammaproteobacteria bacterium]|nr:hypothetical protein [Gammaproteobacteria bacterium]